MKICLVHEEYPEETNFGGIATYQKRMAFALKKLGHDIIVISRALQEEQDYIEDGIRIIRLLRNNTGSLYDDYFQYRIKVADVLKKLIADKEIDIIECPDWGAEIINYVNERKVPIVVRLHTPLCVWKKYNNSGIKDDLDNYMLEWEKYCILNADFITSCSNLLLDELAPFYSFKSNDIKVIPNPANTKDFYPMKSCHNSKVILYCGSLEQRKGVDILAKAIPIVLETLNDYDIKFVFIGEDTYRNDKSILMSDYIKSLLPKKFHSNIDFLGHVENKLLNKFYNLARIGVVPSRFDNLPYVAQEQLLTELPVIASDNTGVKEMIVDGDSGYLFKSGDYIDLAKKIVMVYSNWDKSLLVGKKGRLEILKKHSSDIIAKNMEKLYLEVIHDFKREK